MNGCSCPKAEAQTAGISELKFGGNITIQGTGRDRKTKKNF
jgi:hypothetical protein